jgi:hypothetical protein
MLKRIAKLAAYAKAPKATFAMLHPIKAVKWGAILMAAKVVLDKVTGPSEKKKKKA